MSYQLIRNVAVKSCTAKIFGIGCFTKSYDCCLCQNFTELHQFAFFAMFQSSRGENPFSLMTEEHWQLQCRNILVQSIIRLLAVAANWIMQGWRQTRTICCTSQNSYIHKRSKMVKVSEKSVSPRAFMILIHANQHQSESVICDDKNQYWSRDGGRLISCSEADYQVINDPSGAFGTFRTTSLSKLSKSYQTWSERPHHLKL